MPLVEERGTMHWQHTRLILSIRTLVMLVAASLTLKKITLLGYARQGLHVQDREPIPHTPFVNSNSYSNSSKPHSIKILTTHPGMLQTLILVMLKDLVPILHELHDLILRNQIGNLVLDPLPVLSICL